ncbi:hypothetical protein HID58_027028 [Brassica napus]|uniref:Protein kinase domain-containing protein n=1 Tax=Brassica napus TaxID=3708 RepID=A0ABQ8CQS5_BRANA|nr:hypothetical protein HID58_027028 [Brassica napus]
MKRIRFSWKNICLPISCINNTNQKTTCTTNPSKERLLLLSKQTSVRSRVYLSDFSNSTISLNDLSNSYLIDIHIFTFEELKTITQGFSKYNYLGEGGFGEVYKGFVDNSVKTGLKAQPVAVKALKREGGQGHREWLAEVVILGQLKHPNLVNLIGYCCEDDHRLLVYEYMERGNLEDHLFQKYGGALPWLTRVNILLGAAKGLDFLHKEEKPVIYRDFKPSNILLSSDPNKLEQIIDPSLEGRYSLEGIRKAAVLAYQCLSHNPKSRPTMATVVKTLERILDLKDIQNGPFVYIVPVAGANKVHDIKCN